MPGEATLVPPGTIDFNGELRSIHEALMARDIALLQQLGDSVNRQGVLMQNMLKSQQDMALQIGIMVSQEHGMAIKELELRLRGVEDVAGAMERLDRHEDRLRLLESSADKQAGAVSLVGWLGKNWQGLALLVGGAVIYLKGWVK